jgi:hypothetical protein
MQPSGGQVVPESPDNDHNVDQGTGASVVSFLPLRTRNTLRNNRRMKSETSCNILQELPFVSWPIYCRDQQLNRHHRHQDLQGE